MLRDFGFTRLQEGNPDPLFAINGDLNIDDLLEQAACFLEASEDTIRATLHGRRIGRRSAQTRATCAVLGGDVAGHHPGRDQCRSKTHGILIPPKRGF